MAIKTRPLLQTEVGSGPRLADRLANRNNALNLIRLILAVAVIVAHVWPLAGLGEDPVFLGNDLGGWAVACFFSISGYLIMGSRLNSGLKDFLMRRAFRIFPAFWICLVLIAVVFAPLAAWKEHASWSPMSAGGYVIRNAGLWINQGGIRDTLVVVPYPNEWDASLWTLSFEFLAYIGAGLLLCLPLARRYPASVTAAFLALATLAVPATYGPMHLHSLFLAHSLKLGTFFVAGMFVRSVAHRIPAGLATALVALVAFYGVSASGLQSHWMALPLAVMLIWLGGVVPLHWGARNDVSYGIYIYGVPSQQIGAVFGLTHLYPPIYLVTSLMTVVPLACASWWWIERPALRWSHRRLTKERAPKTLSTLI